jgi:hypothetical protein
MFNVMHKFLIYLSIYFCLTCFWLSLSPSSVGWGTSVPHPTTSTFSSWSGRWHHTQETRTTAEFVHLPLKMDLKKARDM